MELPTGRYLLDTLCVPAKTMSVLCHGRPRYHTNPRDPPLGATHTPAVDRNRGPKVLHSQRTVDSARSPWVQCSGFVASSPASLLSQISAALHRKWSCSNWVRGFRAFLLSGIARQTPCLFWRIPSKRTRLGIKAKHRIEPVTQRLRNSETQSA